jgi:Excalibur calcium-binding domain
MKRLIVLLIVAALGWAGYGKYQRSIRAADPGRNQPHIDKPAADRGVQTEVPPTSAFRCDGRIYCSQMTSCAEATYFLRNCPGVKMDGDNDGIPCERQWCQ